MIISQTPLRVSFFGGGTDFKEYYEKYEGTVVSAAINKFIYIIIKERMFDDDIVLNYSQIERVQDVNDIKHDIIREALKITKITKGIEITSLADVPLQGAGLGSSSSFTVGLLHALFVFQGRQFSPYDLAEAASDLEINILGEPIGKQDQYAATFGSCNEYIFKKDGSVEVNNIGIDLQGYQELSSHMTLLYTGMERRSFSVLSDQKNKIEENIENLPALKRMALEGKELFRQVNSKAIGEVLKEAWNRKKLLSKKIYNDEIDQIFETGMSEGAYGGKLLGAGGGGFFLFVCSLEKKAKLRSSLRKYKELSFAFERKGSRILLNTISQTKNELVEAVV